MECLEKPAFKNHRKGTFHLWTLEELRSLKIEKPDGEIFQKVLARWDGIAKPLDGMGRFETLLAQIGAVCGTEDIDLSRKAVIILCADNGIVEEGISQSGQEVTLAVARNMAERRSSAGRMAETIGADIIPVDIGINSRERIPGVRDKKIRAGTRNFRKEPAMTEQEALAAVLTGVEAVSECRQAGYRILAVGEMGIGNTTTSSAVTAALLNCDAAEVTGRGAGLDDAGLIRKRKIIEEALARYRLKGADAFQILRTVGGLDIGGLAGVCIGGALFHVPIVLDGVISLTAALTAQRLVPGIKDYLIPSHKGKEPAMKRLAEELGLRPVIDGEMALGEGTGAVMMLSLLDLALSVYRDGAGFSETQIKQYERF